MVLCQMPTKWSTSRRTVFKNGKRIIAEFGIGQVTIDDIAKGYMKGEKPLSKIAGSVSRDVARALFSKEKLLKVIIEQTWPTIIKQVGRIVYADKNPSHKLMELLYKIPLLLEEDLEAAGILIRERYPTKKPKDALQGSRSALKCMSMLKDLFKEIEVHGNLKDKEQIGDIDSVIHALYGALEQGMLNAYFVFVRTQDSKIQGIINAHKRVEQLQRTLRVMGNSFLKKPVRKCLVV